MSATPAPSAARTRRKTQIAAANPPIAALPLDPARIAFTGSAQLDEPAPATVYVQVLCWPIMATAWGSLTQTWRTTRVERGDRKPPTAAAASVTSWIRACAPQLGAPFRDSTAEDSSIAALLTRTPIEIAVVIQDSRKRRDPAGTREHPQLEALSGCLSHYSDAARARRRNPCAMLLSRARGPAIDRQCLKELEHAKSMNSETGSLAQMQLHFWDQPKEPLPLELANVIAAAVLKHLLDRDGFNPVFEAVLGKLVHPAFPYAMRAKKR
ncbi:MAG TPA: hypothetical protein VN581_11190 [Patescibacteria group bacterium]|nr:hypothetical protein [Patescibacteria group bacterium]